MCHPAPSVLSRSWVKESDLSLIMMLSYNTSSYDFSRVSPVGYQSLLHENTLQREGIDKRFLFPKSSVITIMLSFIFCKDRYILCVGPGGWSLAFSGGGLFLARWALVRLGDIRHSFVVLQGENGQFCFCLIEDQKLYLCTRKVPL